MNTRTAVFTILALLLLPHSTLAQPSSDGTGRQGMHLYYVPFGIQFYKRHDIRPGTIRHYAQYEITGIDTVIDAKLRGLLASDTTGHFDAFNIRLEAVYDGTSSYVDRAGVARRGNKSFLLNAAVLESTIRKIITGKQARVINKLLY